MATLNDRDDDRIIPVIVQEVESAPPRAHTCYHCGETIEHGTPCVSHRVVDDPYWVYYHPTAPCREAAEVMAATVVLRRPTYGSVQRDIDRYDDWLSGRTEHPADAPWQLHAP